MKLSRVVAVRNLVVGSLTIGVQNLKTIEKPLKAMVWGLKIIKWPWLNDPKTIEKPSSPMVSY